MRAPARRCDVAPRQGLQQLLNRRRDLLGERAVIGDQNGLSGGVMLGLGETEAELLEAMDDLREARCDILTLGQYLQPTLKHLPVAEFVTPEKFDEYGKIAEEKGFGHVASGPMVRSSYHADEITPLLKGGVGKPSL